MIPRILEEPLSNNQSFFLFGPRGTGKTTWIKSRFKNALYLDLLDSTLSQKLLSNPSRLRNLVLAKVQDWVIIDEIQKIPELLNEVHKMIEENHCRFILTGSSARNLRKKGVNLLGGRALTFHMYPLTVEELGERFDLQRSLDSGHLPMVYSVKSPTRYLSSYVSTYLQQEVQSEGLTRNLSAFSRFMEIASFSQAQVLNVSEIAREVGVDSKTIENYFTILEDLLIADRVPVFTRKAKRRMITHSKFFFFDVGVYRTLRPMSPLDKPEEAAGAALETIFYQELKAINDYYNLGYQIFYWRTANNEEVDFVIYGEKGIIAFEIKRSNRFSQKDLSSLKLFLKDYPMACAYFLFGGDISECYDKVKVIPFDVAIRQLKGMLTKQ